MRKLRPPEKLLSHRLREAMGSERARELSLRTKISEPALSRYLNDKAVPRYQQMVKLAVALNVSFEWLATGRGPMRMEVAA